MQVLLEHVTFGFICRRLPVARSLPPDVRMSKDQPHSFVLRSTKQTHVIVDVGKGSTWDACMCWVCVGPGAVVLVSASFARRLNLQCQRMFVELERLR
jgi:hypothetical protein